MMQHIIPRGERNTERRSAMFVYGKSTDDIRTKINRGGWVLRELRTVYSKLWRNAFAF